MTLGKKYYNGVRVLIELFKDKETLKYMDLKIRWNEDEQGNSTTTVQRLKESIWNTETHKTGTWRENLRHLEKTANDIFKLLVN